MFSYLIIKTVEYLLIILAMIGIVVAIALIFGKQ